MQLSNFLRIVLKLDAVSCLGMGALVLATAGELASYVGIDAALLRGAATSLFPIGFFIFWLSFQRNAHALLVWIVIVGNLGWTAASFATAGGLPEITLLGQAVVVGQGLIVLGLAIAEWAGLRGSRPVPASTAA